MCLSFSSCFYELISFSPFFMIGDELHLSSSSLASIVFLPICAFSNAGNYLYLIYGGRQNSLKVLLIKHYSPKRLNIEGVFTFITSRHSKGRSAPKKPSLQSDRKMDKWRVVQNCLFEANIGMYNY